MSTDHPAEPGDRSEGPLLPADIDLATGVLRWAETDLRISGRGIDFAWTRTYRSRPGGGAPHWDHAYRLRAARTGLGIQVWHGDGTSHTYRRRTDGGYWTRGVFAEGALDSTDVFRLRFADGRSWEFRPLTTGCPDAGHLAAVVDRNGNALRFAYNEAGLLEVVTDTLGRDIRVTHDHDGRLVAVTDFTGRRVGYTYSADGDLVSVRHPAVTGTPTGNDFPDGAETAYSYGADHRLTGITDRTGAPLLGVEYAESLGTDRVVTLCRGGDLPTHVSYAAYGTTTSVLAIVNDPVGNVRDFLFDEDGSCLRVREYTARADPSVPTTATDNRPAGGLRATEVPYYETRCAHANPDGLLTRVEHPNGSVVDREYEIDRDPDASPTERGNLRRIRTTPGLAGAEQAELVRTFDYLAGYGCTRGRAFVTRETDARGAAVVTDRDDRGNAVRVTRRDGSQTRYTYNAFGDVTSRILDEDVTGARRRDVFTYSDRHGRLVRQTLDVDGLAATSSFRYDELGRLVVVRDPAVHEHEQVWQAWDLLVRSTRPNGSTTEDRRYDAAGRLVGTTVLAAGARLRETRTYDRGGRLHTIAEDTGSGRVVVTAYDYDGNGNRVAVRSGDAKVTRFAFDTRDQVLRRGHGPVEVTVDYDWAGNPTRIARGSGAQQRLTRAGHDGYGRLAWVETPDGVTTSFCRDANGNVLRVVRRAEGGPEPVVEVVQAVDAMDRVVLRRTTGWGIAEPVIETWDYDPRGRLVGQVTAAGERDRVRHDGLDRPVVVDRDGEVSDYVYDANSNLLVETHGALRTHHARDDLGRPERVVGSAGMSWEYDYGPHDLPVAVTLAGSRRLGLDRDGLGRLVGVTWGEAGGAVVARTAQVWDDASRVVERTDPNGNTTSYTFDDADHLTAVGHPDGSRHTVTFDSRGNRTGWTDANGTTVVESYDEMDRLVRREVRPGPGVATDTTTETYAYDVLGRLVAAVNDQHAVEWVHDRSSPSVTEEQDGRTVRSTYDGAGRRVALDHPSGYRLEFSHEGAELRGIADERGPVVEVAEDGSVRYPRTPVTSTVEFTDTGSPMRLRTSAGSAVLVDRRYRWDVFGAMTRVDISDERGYRTVRYTADALGRLRASASSDGAAATYELDAAGNRTSAGYTMARADRVANRYTSTPADRRTYDANGNLLTVSDQRGTRSMRYDYRNRMVEHRDVDGTVTRYGYDCLDRRLTKTVGGVELTYAFDGDEIVEERETATGAVRSLVRHGRALYGMTGSAGETWFVTDALGSVVAELDDAGTVVRTFDFGDHGQVTVRDRAGEEVPATGDVPPVLYAGYAFDAESGLHRTRTRYLEPATGRFTTRDPAGTWADPGNRGNGYTHAADNPVVFVDPSGRTTSPRGSMSLDPGGSGVVDELVGECRRDAQSGVGGVLGVHTDRPPASPASLAAGVSIG